MTSLSNVLKEQELLKSVVTLTKKSSGGFKNNYFLYNPQLFAKVKVIPGRRLHPQRKALESYQIYIESLQVLKGILVEKNLFIYIACKHSTPDKNKNILLPIESISH